MSELFFNETITKARYLAIKLHAGQVYGNYPYIKHCEDVYNILVKFNITDIDILSSAFLHDSIEDGATSYSKIKKQFNIDIAEIVYAVTDELGRNRKEKHEKTYPKIKDNIYAIYLKLADRIANIEFSMLDKETSKYDMYKSEYTTFREHLFPIHSLEKEINMWNYLDFLMSFEK